MATTSQPRSLLSIARLNNARLSLAVGHLKACANSPDVAKLKRCLLPDQLVFVPVRDAQRLRLAVDPDRLSLSEQPSSAKLNHFS
jgi:hypothetical protein